MSRTSVCPERAVLRRLLDGSLARHEQRTLEKHCNGCDACQAHLEELAYDKNGNPSPISCPHLEVLKRLLDGSLRRLRLRGHRAPSLHLQDLRVQLRSPEQRRRARAPADRVSPACDLEAVARRRARPARTKRH